MAAVAEARKADFSEVPVIDIAPLIAREPGATARIAAQIRDACEAVGFFYIKGHGVPDALIERTFTASRRFVELAPDDPDILAGKPLAGPNQWPDLPGWKADVQAYYETITALGNHVLRGL